jgi:4a-hydroxytetrahydrobiopterin dehydratase
MASVSKAKRRARGRIEELSNGSFRVKLYAGIDPISRKRLYLVETIAAGPRAGKEAEQARTRLLHQVDERQSPRTPRHRQPAHVPLPSVWEACMSEQGWQEFLAAEGVEDWVVLHGGATAVFRVASLGEAARLAGAVAQVPGLDGSGALLTVADDRLSVRLTRGVFRLEVRHIDLARAVSATARRHGAVADRAGVQEVQLAIAAKPDAVDVGFWRAVLGYAPLADDNAIDPLGHGSTVWMQELNPDKPLRHAMHIDVSVGRDHVEARVAAALAAEGRIVDDADAPAGWILADRAGNRVCIAAWPDGSVPTPPADPQWARARS